jgi:hypothetical protein
MATKVTQKIINVDSVGDMGELSVQLLKQETQAAKNPVTDITGTGPARPLIKVSGFAGEHNDKHPERAVNFTAQESPEIKQARALAETTPAPAPATAVKPEAPAKPKPE